MSAIQSLQTAQSITGAMVRQAMREAKGDAGKMQSLQQICNQKPEAFTDVRIYDLLFTFVQQYYQDVFVFKDSNSNPAALPPRGTEARISKLEVVSSAALTSHRLHRVRQGLTATPSTLPDTPRPAPRSNFITPRSRAVRLSATPQSTPMAIFALS